MCLILTPSPFYGLKGDELNEAIRYDSFREKEIHGLFKVDIMKISEFQPLVEHCRKWLADEPDQSFRNRSRENILESMMKIIHYDSGTFVMINPSYICKHDMMAKNEKWNIWSECFAKYLKRRKIETDYWESKKMIGS